MNIPDNYDKWVEHEAQQDKWLSKRPVCEYCGHPIQDDHHYEINGDIFCEECLNTHFRKEAFSDCLDN